MEAAEFYNVTGCFGYTVEHLQAYKIPWIAIAWIFCIFQFVILILMLVFCSIWCRPRPPVCSGVYVCVVTCSQQFYFTE